MPPTRGARVPTPQLNGLPGESVPSIPLVVHTLGTARIEGGTTTIRPSAAKRFALLLYLCSEQRRTASRILLQELLFPHLSEPKARHALRELVYELRQVGIPFTTDVQTIALGSNVTVRVDSEELTPTRRMTDAQVAGAMGGWLPEYAPIASERYTTWYEAYRADSIRAVLRALFAELGHAAAAGDWTRGERIARACLALDPLNEQATFARAELLALNGDRPSAMRCLDAYVSELGPDAALLAPEVAGLRRRVATLVASRPAPDVLPFVGRASEMTVVATALQAAATVGVQTVLLWGDPGIGKSRILDESMMRVELEGGIVLRCNAHPHDMQRPMGVFADLVPTLLKQRGAIGCSPTSMKWLQQLGGEPVARVAQTGQNDRVEQVERMADEARLSEETANEIARALLDVLSAIASETRLVLVVDDVQWIDTASLALMRDITRGRRPVGLVFLLAAHDDVRVRASGQWGDHFVARHVGPLDAPMAASLIERKLDVADDEEPTLIAWMVEAAAGNPFYLDILLTHYRTTGERFTVPERLSSLIDRRYAGLSRDARAVLEAVVGLGRYATVDRVERMLSLSGIAVMNAARELEVGRFIVVTDVVAGRLQPFHWLIAECVQRNATPLAQRILYRQIASHLEAEVMRAAEAAPDVAPDGGLLWACAEAWVVAGEAAHAADLLTACAARAMRIGRAAEAADLYLRAAGLSSRADRDEFVETAIRVAGVVRESPTVLRAASLLGSRPRSRSEDSAIALAVLDARIQFEENVLANVGEIETFAQDETIALPQRLEAARMLMVLCNREALWARAIAQRDTLRSLALAPAAAPVEVRLAPVIAYESMYGDQWRVPPLCRLLFEHGKSLRPDLAAVTLLRAAYGLIRSGEAREALCIAEQAYTVANKAGLHVVAFETLLLLASCWPDVGETTLGETWLGHLRASASQAQPTQSEVLALRAIETEHALSRGDIDFVKSATIENEAPANTALGLKARRWNLALSCLVDHLNGARLDPTATEARLTQHHVKRFELGDPGDFEVAVLSVIYADAGNPALARRCILAYLRESRRFGFPLSRLLRSTAKRVGVNEATMQGLLERKVSAGKTTLTSLALPPDWPMEFTR